eukprot:4147167-Pyramimonas_sp.AAC.1
MSSSRTRLSRVPFRRRSEPGAQAAILAWPFRPAFFRSALSLPWTGYGRQRGYCAHFDCSARPTPWSRA